ncbi:MAG: hypothetical protein WBG92_06795 [Thiohalocapsa sp.]
MRPRHPRSWRQRAEARNDSADDERTRIALERLSELLRRVGSDRADEVAVFSGRLTADPSAAWRELDSNAWCAGVSSLAAGSMADNPGLRQAEWLAEIRLFRELLIEIAETLRARGETNPGLPSWLLAFRNWNASDVQ